MATIQFSESDVAPLLLLLDGAALRQPRLQAQSNRQAPRDDRLKRRREGSAGCGVALRPVEMALVWEDSVICGRCYQRRQAAHILAAVVARQMPSLAAVAEAARSGRRSWASRARRFLRRPIKTATSMLRR